MTRGRRNKKANHAGADAYERLRGEIAAQHGGLSDRLRTIAEYALDNPTDMALGTVAEVAKRAGQEPRDVLGRFVSEGIASL